MSTADSLRQSSDQPGATGLDHTSVAPGGLFTRNATGLVRSVTQADNVALAFIAGIPVLGLSIGVFFALAGFPGGNFPLAALVGLPIGVAFAYLFGMLTAAIPRTGGDYTLVTRILTPGLGLISSFAMMLAVMISVAYVMEAFSTIALGPGLQILGLVSHSHGLFSAGATIIANKNWQFAIGVALVVVVGAIFLLGVRWTRRAMAVWFFLTMVGLAFSVLVALVTSKGAFISHFDSFARPYTHQANSYAGILATAHKAGVVTASGFSFTKTIPLMVIFATFGIYAYTASYAGGELRQGGTMKTAHRMGLGAFSSITLLLLGSLIFFHAWGKDFLTAAYGGGLPASLGSSPTYFVLTSAQLHSTVITFLLVVSFLAVFPLGTALNMVITTRTLFAYAFDGILPRRIAAVSSRTAAPTVATVGAVLLYVLMSVWAVYVATSFVEVFAYAALIQFVSMFLVAVAGTAMPFRRRELFRASVSNRRVAGIPLLSIIGAFCICTTIFMVWGYLHYSYFGITNKTNLLLWVGGTLVAAIVVYLIARLVRKRQGIDLSLVYAEIPPE